MGALEGRKALVTGSGIGIGRGIALELAAQGASVVLHYAHSREGAEEAVRAIQESGVRACAVGADLTRVEECRRLTAEAARWLEGLDVLVNNAGVTRTASFLETSEATYQEVMDLNMRSYFFCAQEAVRHMQRQGGGAILNITSVHGASGFAGHAAYAASKGAIIAFTRELAIELAPMHIRVNAIGPGVVEVPRYFEIRGYTTEFGSTLVPWGRVGTPEDVGRAAAFLVSDAADFITGQVLFVDGGTNARMGLWWERE